MLSDNDLQEMIRQLNGDTDEVKHVLGTLSEMPTGDKRLLPHLEALLDDRRPCILGVPYQYGELRWLVAETLVAERAVMGIKEPIILKAVVTPLTSWELEQLCKEVGIDLKLKVLDKVSELIRLNKAPVQNRPFWLHKTQKSRWGL